MQASGSIKQDSNRFNELKYAIEDIQSETEVRDLSVFCKSAVPVIVKDKPRHVDICCQGNQTSMKQRSIVKLYIAMLKKLAKERKGEASEAPRTESLLRKYGAHTAATKEKTYSDFVSLIDHIHSKKREVRRDLHMRQESSQEKDALISTSDFTRTKP